MALVRALRPKALAVSIHRLKIKSGFLRNIIRLGTCYVQTTLIHILYVAASFIKIFDAQSCCLKYVCLIVIN